MPRRRPEAPAIDMIEQDFLSAIDRLELKTPHHPLLQKKARAGALRLNKLTVAMEAGHSRTKIYDYPRVIACIGETQLPARETKSARDVIKGLREENALLRREKAAALSALAAMALRLQLSIKDHRKKIRELEREAKHPGRNSIHIITDNVISIKKD
jgi:hypothetical protein